MRTGVLVKRAGVTRDTLRYYEREGLITPPVRLMNGYRDYPEQVLEEIRFIRLGQSVGLPLQIIRRAIPYLVAPRPGCQELRAVLEAQMRALDEQMDALRLAKARLSKWLLANRAAAIDTASA
ncbi:MerR family transcriptional regulator [Dyella sp.]|jgi:MerR family mercuric resistance operon transcriptional regulator/MerR family copper efflux transcriptional regulator|uniref:MerR family transcriptional regulator n=1 Tax=Dyella sp. TaxID=1869338 RepID=UPI002FD8969D